MTKIFFVRITPIVFLCGLNVFLTLFKADLGLQQPILAYIHVKLACQDAICPIRGGFRGGPRGPPWAKFQKKKKKFFLQIASKVFLSRSNAFVPHGRRLKRPFSVATGAFRCFMWDFWDFWGLKKKIKKPKKKNTGGTKGRPNFGENSPKFGRPLGPLAYSS